MVKKSTIVALGVFFVWVSSALSVEVPWVDRTGDHLWKTTNNWTYFLLPTLSDEALIERIVPETGPAKELCIIDSGTTGQAYSVKLGWNTGPMMLDVQQGGALNIQKNMVIGGANAAPYFGDGTLKISGGQVSVIDQFDGTTRPLIIGDAANGKVHMTGGNFEFYPQTFIGNAAGSLGTIIIDGGTFKAKPQSPREVLIGHNGNANVTVNGGTLNLSEVVARAAFGSASQTTITINNGTMSVGRFFLANSLQGKADIFVNGGTLNVNTGAYGNPMQFSVGFGASFATSTVNIAGGTVNGGNMYVGSNNGRGTVRITGGVLNANILTIGLNQSSVGHLQVDGGRVNVTMPSNSFNIGLSTATGSMDMKGGDFYWQGGDKVTVLQGLINSGKITFHGGHPAAVYHLGIEQVEEVWFTRLWVDPLDTTKAWAVYPKNSTTVPMSPAGTLNLEWLKGDFGNFHDVYFGDDAAAVANATTASPEYKGRQANATPNIKLVNGLELGKTYYWRIDELNANPPTQTTIGDVWQFTVAPCLAVDDFESYGNIQAVWGSNATLETTVKRGTQSMRIAGQKSVTRTTPFSNWTTAGVEALRLYFNGKPTNSASARQMAVTLHSGAASKTVYYDGRNTDIVVSEAMPFTEWNIDMADFTGVNLSNVTQITITIGGSAGDVVYIDDIAVCVPMCIAGRIAGDYNYDCACTMADMNILSREWQLADDPNRFVTYREYDMSTDPVGNGMVVGNPVDLNANYVISGGQMQITGRTFLGVTEGRIFNSPTKVRMIGRGTNTTGVHFWIDMLSPNPQYDRCMVGFRIYQESGVQKVEIKTGNNTLPGHFITFGNDNPVDLEITYYPRTMKYSYVAANGTQTFSNTVDYTVWTGSPAGGGFVLYNGPGPNFEGQGVVDYLKVSVADPLQTDINRDGVVNVNDLVEMAYNWMQDELVWP